MIQIEEKDGSIIVPFKITPKASRNAIGAEFNGALKLFITAPPVDGKANKSILKFLSKTFHLPQRDIQIVSGLTGSNKKIRIKITSSEFRQKIQALSQPINGKNKK